jgi:hypothetical protein
MGEVSQELVGHKDKIRIPFTGLQFSILSKFFRSEVACPFVISGRYI